MHQLPQTYFNRVMRAIIEFDLLTAGDRILIGLSGGKDSVFMTYALAALRDRLPHDLQLAALTIDPLFSDDFPVQRLADFCASLKIDFHCHHVDIAAIIEQQNGKDPCFSCAFFRRGAINRFAKEHGYNKIAYAHHHDDAVETFFMNLLYSGQLKTFLPKTYLSRMELTVIRPLIYFRESELRAAQTLHQFLPVDSPCPYDGHTKRQTVKELIDRLNADNTALYSHLASAMHSNSVSELWPPELNRAAMKKKYHHFMNIV